MSRVLLDTRALAHPKPLEMAIAALRELGEKRYLYMLNRKNPIPLIHLAEQHGYRTLSQEVSEGEWHILITKNREISLEEMLHV